MPAWPLGASETDIAKHIGSKPCREKINRSLTLRAEWMEGAESPELATLGASGALSELAWQGRGLLDEER